MWSYCSYWYCVFFLVFTFPRAMQTFYCRTGHHGVWWEDQTPCFHQFSMGPSPRPRPQSLIHTDFIHMWPVSLNLKRDALSSKKVPVPEGVPDLLLTCTFIYRIWRLYFWSDWLKWQFILSQLQRRNQTGFFFFHQAILNCIKLS